MPQRNEFSGTEIGMIGGAPTDRQSRAIDRALETRAIRIRNIDAASKRIIADYPKLAAWFCLSVKPRAEFAVEDALKEAGVMACVPRRKGDPKRHRHGGQVTPTLPVIPGYMLVCCVPSVSAFIGLRSVDKVTGIIGSGERRYRIPARKIEHFIEMAHAGGYDYRPVHHSFCKGQEVRVCEGPFASFNAIITDLERAEKEGRLNVEVNIFGRMTPIELDVAQIEKL